MHWIHYEPGDYRLDDGRTLYRVVRINANEWQGQVFTLGGWSWISTTPTKRESVKACEADRMKPKIKEV